MRILFIYWNRFRTLAAPPVGLSMVANSVAGSHETEFLDFMWEGDPFGKADEIIKSFKPELIAISLRNLDTQDSRKENENFIEDLEPFVAKVKEACSAKVILGGTAFTTFPAEILALSGADYGVAGQGEDVFPMIADCLAAGNMDTTLPGLVYRQEGEIKMNPPMLGGYPKAFTPDDVFYDPKKYKKSFWPSVVVTKTGCPFPCVFCDVETSMGKQFQLRDPEVIVSELEYHVEKLKTRTVFLVNTCFNHPIDHGKEILEAIIRSKLKLFLGTTLRPDGVDEELITLMRRAGLRFVGLGADTLSETTLASYKKGFDLGTVKKCADLLEKVGVDYMLEVVLGGPGETKETVEESLTFLATMRPTLALVHGGFRILPRTHLFDTAKGEGLVNDRSDVLFPKFYFSPDIEPAWLFKRIGKYYMRYGYRQVKTPLLFMVKRPAHLWFSEGR